jgi:hypothetical protein
VVLGMEARALCIRGKYSITEVDPQAKKSF